ncbi:hypothetical protein BC628DRAFT_1378319 [Trametes gibbosa]|nr:hypothetical protein BC628DRAFT_1378319 [Trametes gibbosa]
MDARDYVDQFVTYPFTTDETYQQGFAGIVTSGALNEKTEEEKTEIMLRSEVFYFNRLVGSSLTIDDARRARQARTVPQYSSTESISTAAAVEVALADSDQPAPQMLSLAQLKALIEEGRTDEIPNNKVIPNVLSSEPPSESRAAPPKKPWEAIVAS